MGSEGRLSRGWRLTGDAWCVIWSDRASLTLAITQAVVSAAIALVIFWSSGWVHHPGDRSRLVIAGLIAYWPAMLIGTFLGVALAAATSAALDGRHLTVLQALAVPARRPGQILLWSLLASVVGLVIHELAQRLPFAGRIVGWVGGLAWSLVSLFVIPILAIEGCTATACIRRSSKLLKQRWGESLTGTITIGGWIVVVIMPLAVVVGAIAGATHDQGWTWLSFIAAMVLVSSLGGAATRVFAVALYRYATTHRPQPPFPQADLERPFTPKRNLFGRRHQR